MYVNKSLIKQKGETMGNLSIEKNLLEGEERIICLMNDSSVWGGKTKESMQRIYEKTPISRVFKKYMTKDLAVIFENNNLFY